MYVLNVLIISVTYYLLVSLANCAQWYDAKEVHAN